MDNNINFLGIGSQKCGTTWLYARLRELPEFYLPPEKEIHYFDRDKKYPSPNYLAIDHFKMRIFKKEWIEKATIELWRKSKKKDLKDFFWMLKFYTAKYNDEWYLNLFSNRPEITGEITPSYSILNVNDIDKVKRIAPSAKIILLIRNPIHRAWSHYRHNVNQNLIKGGFDNITIKEIIDFLHSDEQLLRTDYVRTISNWVRAYPNNKIILGFYDAIVDNPYGLLSNIVGFLGGNLQSIQNNCKLSHRNNVSPKLEIPSEIANELKRMYGEQIETLANSFGGYCKKWLLELQNNKTSEISFRPTVILNEDILNTLLKNKVFLYES